MKQITITQEQADKVQRIFTRVGEISTTLRLVRSGEHETTQDLKAATAVISRELDDLTVEAEGFLRRGGLKGAL